jgi:tight adherence protein C
VIFVEAYIAIGAGIFIFMLIVLMNGSGKAREDRVRRRISDVMNSNAKYGGVYDEDMSKSLYIRIVMPFLKSLSAKLAKYAPKGRPSNTGKLQSEKLKKSLRQAGISMGVDEYSMIRMFVIAGTAGILTLFSVYLGQGYRSVFGALLGAYVGYVALRLSLTFRISARRASMEQQLPDVLDLLSVNVEAGLGFEQALLNVIGHFEGPLIEELTVTYREISMGRTRRDALLLFAERCELEEVKSFTGAIIQAEQLGISIKNILRTQSSTMRTARRRKVEEKAQKVQVKMLFPMIGFIFPVLLIVLLGPALVSIIVSMK